MITFEEAYGWLNFIEKKSNLNVPVDQIITTMKDELKKELDKMHQNKSYTPDFSRVCSLMDLSIEVSRSLSGVVSNLSRAETHLECACACYQMLDITRSIHEFKNAISFYSGQHEHNEAVARWLIGCAYWRRSNQHTGIVQWEKSCHLFRNLKDLSAENAWYNETLGKMCDTLRSSIKHGRWPYE